MAGHPQDGAEAPHTGCPGPSAVSSKRRTSGSPACPRVSGPALSGCMLLPEALARRCHHCPHLLPDRQLDGRQTHRPGEGPQKDPSSWPGPTEGLFCLTGFFAATCAAPAAVPVTCGQNAAQHQDRAPRGRRSCRADSSKESWSQSCLLVCVGPDLHCPCLMGSPPVPSPRGAGVLVTHPVWQPEGGIGPEAGPAARPSSPASPPGHLGSVRLYHCWAARGGDTCSFPQRLPGLPLTLVPPHWPLPCLQLHLGPPPASSPDQGKLRVSQGLGGWGPEQRPYPPLLLGPDGHRGSGLGGCPALLGALQVLTSQCRHRPACACVAFGLCFC